MGAVCFSFRKLTYAKKKRCFPGSERRLRDASMRVCLAAGLLAHSVVAQFGTIRIHWVSEGALGDGRATPHVGGLSAEVEGEEPAPPPAPSADTYEEAWWRDDFAHDPPGVWFGAATTQRGKRPASMASTMCRKQGRCGRPARPNRLIGRG